LLKSKVAAAAEYFPLPSGSTVTVTFKIIEIVNNLNHVKFILFLTMNWYGTLFTCVLVRIVIVIATYTKIELINIFLLF
jgi:hypothetical protein